MNQEMMIMAASEIACFYTVGEKQYGMKTELYSNSQYP